jgi:hypothetical protein
MNCLIIGGWLVLADKEAVIVFPWIACFIGVMGQGCAGIPQPQGTRPEWRTAVLLRAGHKAQKGELALEL